MEKSRRELSAISIFPEFLAKNGGRSRRCWWKCWEILVGGRKNLNLSSFSTFPLNSHSVFIQGNRDMKVEIHQPVVGSIGLGCSLLHIY